MLPTQNVVRSHMVAGAFCPRTLAIPPLKTICLPTTLEQTNSMVLVLHLQHVQWLHQPCGCAHGSRASSLHVSGPTIAWQHVLLLLACCICCCFQPQQHCAFASTLVAFRPCSLSVGCQAIHHVLAGQGVNHTTVFHVKCQILHKCLCAFL